MPDTHALRLRELENRLCVSDMSDISEENERDSPG